MLVEFKKCIQSVNFFLKLIGLTPEIQDNQRTLFERFCNHPIYAINFISLGLQIIAEVLWLLEAIKSNKSFLEIIFIIPCLTLCTLSMFKSFFTLMYAHCINDLLQRLTILQSDLMSSETERKESVIKLVGAQISKLNTISKILKYLIVVVLFMFASGPLFIMLKQYHNTREVELTLPFYSYYPFNMHDMKYYLCAYVYQTWATFITIYFVFVPNYLYVTCCTFVYIHFLVLQHDMERVVTEDVKKTGSNTIKVNIRKLAIRHVELIRCVELLELIFSKSILLNALTSSIIICVTGFNVMINDDILTMASFASAQSFGLIQIFLYCYNGDNIMRSSMQVSDAVYSSQWYDVDPKEKRSLLIILIRAQKPCKITAYNYFDINLEAFTSILSTSWSYFALLKTMYHPDTIKPE